MPLPIDQLKSILVTQGLITDKEFEEVSAYAKSSENTLENALVEKGFITEDQLGPIIAASLHLPIITLSKITIPEDVFRIIPERVAHKNKVVAFARDSEGIKIATSDTVNKRLPDMLASKTGQPIMLYYATAKDIETALQMYKQALQKTVDELLYEVVHSAERTSVIEEAPIARIVDELIRAAYQDKASDIHIEPEENFSFIRFRIDGVLHDVLKIPKNLHDRVLTRLKVLSRLRTDEHLAAQDGKLRVPLDEEKLDIRVSIIPIVDGEKIVMRLLSSNSRQFTLTDLGMSDNDLQKVTNAFNKSYGMILSTGPTGCGKTTSIYAIVKILNTREKNITSIEDPVEYRIKGASQVQVNPKTNLTFANGLRSILRQDPNIIFVGEIRDNETAGIAVNAALTGHLVVSTLHTNDAATAIPRLTDMKVEPFLVASTINIIIAQRLVRKICDDCKSINTLSLDELKKHIPEDAIKKYLGEGPSYNLYKGKGCKICHMTGYKGRLGIFEVLEVDKKIRKLITDKLDADAITRAAVENGMNTMLNDGLVKVMKGQTTIEEVIRVTKVESL
ncbi:type II/IV secretion system protein [Candidatus Gottesmanbacteria bacterium]|nr:type II/IV secretion system protein [Candidatus Gottesmanbacteria bacterium]